MGEVLMAKLAQYAVVAALVTVRVSGLFVFVPIFSSTAVPPRIKAGFLVALVVLLSPIVGEVRGVTPVISVSNVLGELSVGIVIGFSLMLVNEMLLMAATLLGASFSFSLVNVLDPNTMIETAVLGQLLSWFGVLVMIAAGLDRVLLAAFIRTFVVVPVGTGVVEGRIGVELAKLTGTCLLGGLQLAGPVMGAALVAEMVVSMVNRLAPALPVQIVGVSLKTLTSYVVLIGCLSFWPRWIQAHFALLLGAAGKALVSR